MCTFNNRLRPNSASSHKTSALDITVAADHTWMELLST